MCACTAASRRAGAALMQRAVRIVCVWGGWGVGGWVGVHCARVHVPMAGKVGQEVRTGESTPAQLLCSCHCRSADASSPGQTPSGNAKVSGQLAGTAWTRPVYSPPLFARTHTEAVRSKVPPRASGAAGAARGGPGCGCSVRPGGCSAGGRGRPPRRRLQRRHEAAAERCMRAGRASRARAKAADHRPSMASILYSRSRPHHGINPDA